MPDTTIRVQVFGRVQGVCFRHYTRLTAADLGLRGWVRNRADGSVETLIHGPEDKVDELLAWLRHGPDSAAVSHIEVEPAGHAENLPATFAIVR